MPTQSDMLPPQSFLRAQVKSRMLRRAAELWGYSETELDAFDPLVSLLMEACAVEFEKIAAEISETQNRLLNRLAQLMNPEVEVARTAYAILQAQSVEPSTFVQPESQFAYRFSNTDRSRREATTEIYFSPIRKLPIFNGSIAFMASTDTLFRIEEGIQKLPLAKASGKLITTHQPLWLGLVLDEDLKELPQLSFYFNWLNHPDRGTWYKYLPFSVWSLGSTTLTTRMGLPNPVTHGNALPTLAKEMDEIIRIEREMEHLVEDRFVTISTSGAKVEKCLYPEELEQLFGPASLKDIKKPLLWIQVQFSNAIPAEALNALLCSINCVPVINRKLNKLTYKLQPNFNIIPLESDGLFMGIKEVRDSHAAPLHAVPLGNLLELEPRTYTLQYGVNRFDSRNAREMLTNMLDLVRDESSSFSALGEDFLASIIRELNQTIARLEAKVNRDGSIQQAVPYLMIKQAEPNTNIFVEYWTSHGSQANRIPAGTKLQAYADANIQKDSIYLLTTTQGGKDKLKASEKVNHYRQALLSRNRIVTLEDVRAACLKELGETASAVEVRRGFMASNSPRMGCLRCIEVEVCPARASAYTSLEWEQRKDQLRTVLEEQAVGHIPFRITIQSA